MVEIRVRIPSKSLVLLRQFNLDKLTCNLLMYDFAKSMDHINPVHQGKISFVYEKEKLRPYRYEEKIGHTYRFLKAKDLKEMLGKVSLIIMIPSEKPKNLSDYIEFLNYCNAKKPKIMPVCTYCLNDKLQLTRLKSEDEYTIYGKVVCRQCASNEIKGEYTKRGIPLTTSSRKFFNAQLDRYRVVEKVIESIWEPVKTASEQHTSLFDVISADSHFKPRSIRSYLEKSGNKRLFDPELINHWISIGITKFLPVQIKAIEAGLLNKRDLLIVAGTSSGKTLVGELAGLQNWKNRNEKFIFVTPLVALTNQKFDSFKERYQRLGARVAIRVGRSRIVDSEVNSKYDSGNFAKADIIIATYEALDWIFRSGQWKKIHNIGTLVVDEFQLLADEERGSEVDGLLARIRALYPKCQVIGLSATIGNEEELARELNFKLVSYMNRPIPLERHLIISDGEEKKIDILENLVRNESRVMSKSGHPGQTLIFTNTRRRVQDIGNTLKGRGLRSGYYHAGMTYGQRRTIEAMFENGKLEVLTTTAALGAGADFPVSQVIFERPAMGAKWITIAEYHQMAGRAGRFGYHDLGKAVMIATVGEKIYKSQDKSEEQIAFDILTGEVEDIGGEVEYEDELDQILAFISAAYPINDTTLRKYYSSLYFRTDQLQKLLLTLTNKGLIARKDEKWYITSLGRAISESFLKPSFGYEIAKRTKNEQIEEVAVDIANLSAIYVTPRIQAKLEHALKTTLSSRFFSDGILETITRMTSIKGKLSPFLMDRIRFWQRNFLDCTCKSNPYCRHPRQKISLLILELRMEGRSVKQITNILNKEYDLQVYQGDLLNWLDEVIHAVNAIGRLAKAMKNDELYRSTSDLAMSIEAPAINFDLSKKKSKPKLVKAKDQKDQKHYRPPHLRRKQKKDNRKTKNRKK